MSKPCTIDGCDRPQVARGWCGSHYGMWQKRGDPTPVRMYRAPVGDRLRSKLIERPNGCWEYGAAKDSTGYGSFKVRGAMRKAHRIAYEEWVGPIPPGMFVCHHCDNPPCCNPAHLFLGTASDNMRDMAAKGRGDYSGLERIDHSKLAPRAAWLRAEAAVAAGFPETWKHCHRCDQFKAPEDFGVNLKRPDGLQTYCRPCHRQYQRDRWRRPK